MRSNPRSTRRPRIQARSPPSPAPSSVGEAARDVAAPRSPIATDAASREDATAAEVATAESAQAAEVSLSDLGMLDLVDESEPSVVERLLVETSWLRMGWIVLCLALATLAFFTKNAAIRWVSLGVTFVVLGYVDGGFLSVSHITAAIWVGPSVFLGDLPLLLMVTFTVLALLFWGRVFCGYLCPFGALQDFIDAVVPKRFQTSLGPRAHRLGLKGKYGVLAVIVVPALAGSEASLYQYFEPFGTVFSIGPGKVLWAIAGTILLASAVIPRFYCRYVCPLGAALAIGSVFSLNGSGVSSSATSARSVSRSARPARSRARGSDFKECVRCNVCEIELIERSGVCRHDMETIRPRLVQLKARTPVGLSDVVVRKTPG